MAKQDIWWRHLGLWESLIDIITIIWHFLDQKSTNGEENWQINQQWTSLLVAASNQLVATTLRIVSVIFQAKPVTVSHFQIPAASVFHVSQWSECLWVLDKKLDIWRCRFGLWEAVSNILRYLLTFHTPATHWFSERWIGNENNRWLNCWTKCCSVDWIYQRTK